MATALPITMLAEPPLVFLFVLGGYIYEYISHNMMPSVFPQHYFLPFFVGYSAVSFFSITSCPL